MEFAELLGICVGKITVPMFGRSDASQNVSNFCFAKTDANYIQSVYIYIYIQGVPGGMCQTSGECSLC